MVPNISCSGLHLVGRLVIVVVGLSESWATDKDVLACLENMLRSLALKYLQHKNQQKEES